MSKAKAPRPTSDGQAAKARAIAHYAEVRSEARDMFPMQPTSDLRSPYFADSYLYPYNPDPLCSGNRYDTYDEMRKDQQVKSCLSLKKDLVVNSGWEIECEAEDVKEDIERDLRDMNDDEASDSGFEDSLRSMLTSYDYGFSVSEVIAQLEDGRYAPKSIRTRAPHTWQFDLDDKGNLRRLIQIGANGTKELNPRHFIHHVYQSDFGNPYGTSDLQAAHQAWKAKKFFIRMYAVYVERFASPTVVARYKPGSQDDEIAAIQEMARSIQNSTAMTLPDDVPIDFVQAARDATEAYVRGINLWDMMIARALLVPDLMGVSGGKTEGGSFSLGRTQFDLFLGTIQKDRKSLERKVNLRVVSPFARLNHGEEVDAKFILQPWSQDDNAANLELWTKLVALNKYVPSEEEIDHFRRQIKFPTPPIEVITEPDPNAEGASAGDDVDGGEPAGRPEKTAAKTGKQAPAPERERSLSRDAGRLLIFRDLTSYERKVDLPAVKRSLDVSERSLERSVGSAASKMQADLLRQIRESKLLTRFQPEVIATIQPGFAREMNQAMRDELRRLWRESTEEARREILPAGNRKDYTAGDLLPEEFERILEAEGFKLVGDYRTEISKRASNNLIRGIKDGLSEGRLVVNLREDLDAYRDRWLSTLVRTKTTEIYNSARKSIWDTDETISKIVAAYQFSAVLDERTSDVCRHLDGKIFEKGDFADRLTPPLHLNCRSILVPITRYEEYSASKPESLEKLRDMGGGLIQP